MSNSVNGLVRVFVSSFLVAYLEKINRAFSHNVVVMRERKLALWCNGSTTDFDSVLMIDLWCNGNTQVFGTCFPSSSLGRSTFIF